MFLFIFSLFGYIYHKDNDSLILVYGVGICVARQMWRLHKLDRVSIQVGLI